MRVVVDTNVLVSGLLSSRGAPARIVDAVLEGWLVPLASRATLAELKHVLARPRLARWFQRAGHDPQAFLSDYCALAIGLEPPPSPLHIRDEKDRPFMELAQAAPPGTVLVSGDQDIHAVAGAQFRAMTPARFVAEFIADKAR